jgi:hypothetical protein
MAVLLCLVGCAPEDASGTVMAYVFAREPLDGTYALRREPVENLESLRELRGRDVDFRMESELNQVRLDGELTLVRGRPFALEYSREADGTVVAGDLHSLYALSLYRNLDRTASLLRAHGHVPLKRLDLFYFPRFDNILTGDGRGLFTDNAAYLSLAPGFIIVPSFMLGDLPMPLNEGIMAHEYGHAVVHQELFGDAPSAPNLEEWPETHRHLGAMHEGVADLIALIVTGDPDFFAPTTRDVDRNLSEPRDYTEQDLSDLEGGTDDYGPHAHGSIMARAVYELWPKDAQGRIPPTERARLLDATLGALRALRFEQDTFTLASFPDALVARMSLEERTNACAVLRTRLAPLASRLTSCEEP